VEELTDCRCTKAPSLSDRRGKEGEAKARPGTNAEVEELTFVAAQKHRPSPIGEGKRVRPKPGLGTNEAADVPGYAEAKTLRPPTETLYKN